MKRCGIILLISFVCGGCALQPYGLLYSNMKSPKSYPRPWVHSELDPKAITIIGPAYGMACSKNLLGLVATGDSGYDAAVKDALVRSGEGTILYDVKFDKKFRTYLGLYSQFCTEVSGIAAK